MRIVLLGGAGEVGAELARDLAQVREVDSLVVGDLDGERAALLVRELGSRDGRVTAAQVDVRDQKTALRVLADADLLMNCTSFALFDEVLSLAIAAGVDYADLISDP